MRTRLAIIGTIGMITVLSYSCQKADILDSVIYPENARLKKTYYVDSPNFRKISWNTWKNLIMMVLENLSNHHHQIQNGIRIGEYSYKLFEYNSSDQLIKVINYNNCGYCPSGFTNITNSIFYYNDKFKTEKELH